MTAVPLPSADDETDEPISVGDCAIDKTRLLSRQCPTCILRLVPPMHTTRIRLRQLVARARGFSGLHRPPFQVALLRQRGSVVAGDPPPG